MPNWELSVVVMPNGALQTEWVETKENINKSSRLLQKEIFDRFADDADSGLLFLGFCDKNASGVGPRQGIDYSSLTSRKKVFPMSTSSFSASKRAL